jgi:uncharacterized protein (TIGR02145 family)
MLYLKTDLMKKLLFLITMFFTLNANAQNYFITFAGTGSATTVNSVKVENLTSGTSLSLNGGDILHLTGTDGILSVENKQSSEIKIYPNPVTENSLIEFYPPVSGNATISVYEMTGKLVAQVQSYLENSRQVFLLSGLNKGYYLVNVKGKIYRLLGKLLSNSESNANVNIERINSDQAIDEKELNNETKGSQATVEMAYSMGDRLKFTGISGNYSTVITDIPVQDKTIIFNFIACTDHDNNNYPVVEIGTQVWMAINLKTTTYNNGDLIGTTNPATLDITGETTPKYQWSYDGNENNVPVYGRLYTWHAITDSRGVCPTGWYIPTNADWTLLTDFLGGEYYAGGKLKETGTTHWSSPNTGATNESGFTALPGGWRHWNGIFYYTGLEGIWSSSISYNTLNAWFLSINYDYEDVYLNFAGKKAGLSVRCLKISVPIVITTPVETLTTTTAAVGGEVTSYGGAIVTDRGVYWGTAQNPVTTGTKIQIGSGEGSFNTNLTGLTPNTNYYVMAFATNSIGTSYGDEVSFTTLPLTVPELSTTVASSITQTTAISGGNITYDGGTAVTARGVCWSTSVNPTIADNHTSDGPGTGIFISNLKELTINTKYYVRAYATNSIGTNYGDEIFFATKGATGTVSDLDGNTYSTIEIGTQVWMTENLKTTKYNDNKPIPRVTDNTIWKNLTTPGYCWYNNDSLTYKPAYGALYNWFAVNTTKLCPTGWHVPSNDEFIAFVTYLGGLDVAGGKIKETGTTHWFSPNTGATNETGFTGLPGGRRYYYDGSFISLGALGYYWSATEDEVIYGGIGILHYDSAAIEGDGYSKPNGMSVRCIKDETI